MLVLQQKPWESVIIRHEGRVIGKVSPCSIKGNKIRMGYDFLPEFEINREKIDNEKHPGETK